MLTAPIVLSSTIALSPSQAATVARTSGKLVIENFSWEGTPDDLLTDTIALTNAISSPGSKAVAETPTKAVSTPNQLKQFSKALAKGSGSDYSASALSGSDTGIRFNTQCGCFQFDFKAALSAIAKATQPDEQASAGSFVAFYIFDNSDLSSPIDFLEASLEANTPLDLVLSSDSLNIETLYENPGKAGFKGYYQRHFEEGTQLTVRGVTRSAAVAAVPAPPLVIGWVIMPALMWLKRRSQQKELAQVVSDRQFE